jgi:hypothetical protein
MKSIDYLYAKDLSLTEQFYLDTFNSIKI